MKISITERAREYGYVFWTKKMENEMNSFLGEAKKVDVWFNDSHLGEKNIDRKYRRISIGYKNTRTLPLKDKAFVLEFDGNGSLRIKTQ